MVCSEISKGKVAIGYPMVSVDLEVGIAHETLPEILYTMVWQPSVKYTQNGQKPRLWPYKGFTFVLLGILLTLHHHVTVNLFVVVFVCVHSYEVLEKV